jgi:hypothetical protein
MTGSPPVPIPSTVLSGPTAESPDALYRIRYDNGKIRTVATIMSDPWVDVYDGLSDDEIDEIDRIIQEGIAERRTVRTS